MKKITFLASMAVVSLSGLYACKQPAAPSTAESASSTSAPKVENPEIVYVNADSLTANYQYFKDIKSKYESKGKKADADLNARGQSFQKEVAKYQQTAGTMTAEQRTETEARLQRKQQELQAFQQKTGAALQEEQAKDQEEIYTTVETYLKKFAKDKGFKMVLQYQRGIGQILFADASLDVTNEVLKSLNSEYKPKK